MGKFELPRVASLLPSATEMLCAIGGEHLLVGRSHEDNFPASVGHLPILTETNLQAGLSSAEIDKEVAASVHEGRELYSVLDKELHQVRPTVILTQDLCNVCSVSPSSISGAVAALEIKPTVLCFNPLCMEDVMEDMLRLGQAVGLSDQAASVVESLRNRTERVRGLCAVKEGTKRPKVAFVEWADPVFVGGHWTPELIAIAGGEHVLNAPGKKSIRVPKVDLETADADMLVLCPCGLAMEQVIEEAKSERCLWLRKLRAFKIDRAICVDGDAMFNRPGPRLVDALEWLASWMHSDNIDIRKLQPSNFPHSKWPDARPAKRLRDIEDFELVHQSAVSRGELSYKDPETGYSVFSELYMLQRGWCCGSGCRHCPYGHFNVEGRPRVNKIQAPRLCGIGGRRATGQGPLVMWSGLQTPASCGSILCVVFDKDYVLVTEDKTPVGGVMDWVKKNKVELLAVPATSSMQEALKLVNPTEWRIGSRISTKDAWLQEVSSMTQTSA